MEVVNGEHSGHTKAKMFATILKGGKVSYLLSHEANVHALFSPSLSSKSHQHAVDGHFYGVANNPARGLSASIRLYTLRRRRRTGE